MRLTVVSLIVTVLVAVFAAGCSHKPSGQQAPVEIEKIAPLEDVEAPPEEQQAPDEIEKIAPPKEAEAALEKQQEKVAVTPTPATAVLSAEAAKKNLLDPIQLNVKAPETFKAKFTTSKGDFVIEVTRAWSPNGADRFYNLVKNGYYDNCRFFRVISDFMVQFGINGDPELNQVWYQARIEDDPVKESNTRGYVTFAMSGQPDSRTTQIFINYTDNSFLDAQNFSPFGIVLEGMDVVDSFYNEYKGVPSENQPRIQVYGNEYLNKEFPKLDYIKSAAIL